MVDVNLRSTAVRGRGFDTADRVFAATQSDGDAETAFKSDTVAELIELIFENPPSSLSDLQRLDLRTLLRAALVSVNPTGTPTDNATTIDVDGTVWELPDDVVDVTSSGLPTLDDNNYNKLFIDHDTPRVWVGHRTPVPGTPGSANADAFTDSNYLGAFATRPTVRPASTSVFYYDSTLHYFEEGSLYNGQLTWTHASNRFHSDRYR